MNKKESDILKKSLEAHIDLLEMRESNRETPLYFRETKVSEHDSYNTKWIAIFAHHTKSRKNVWFRNYVWNTHSLYLKTNSLTKEETKEMLIEFSVINPNFPTEYERGIIRSFGIDL